MNGESLVVNCLIYVVNDLIVKRLKFISFLAVVTILHVSRAQVAIIDSLEDYTLKAQPGWDQIDHAIGLGEMYVYARLFENARKEVDNIYHWSEKYNIPEAQSYALVIEGIIADESKDDADGALKYYSRAIQKAIDSKDLDALAYSITEFSKIVIWNKGNSSKGIDTLQYLLEHVAGNVSPKNLGTLYKCLGYALTLQGKQDSAIATYDHALKIFQKAIQDPPVDPEINRVSTQLALLIKQIGATYNDLGNLYLKRGDINQAISFKKEAFDAIQKTGIATDLAWMHVNMAKVLSSIGDYGRSLDHIANARKIYEVRKLESDIAWVDAITTSIFLKMKDYATAESYCASNLEYLERANPNSHYYGGTLLNMVTIQFGKNDISAAEDYLIRASEAIKISDQSENPLILQRLNGELSLKKNNLDLASEFFREAIELSDKKGVKHEIAHSQYRLAEVLFLQSQYDKAIFHASIALSQLEQARNSELVKQCYLLLSNIYESQKDYEGAFRNHQKFSSYSDSLYTESTMEKLKSEQVRQDVLGFKEEKELAEQNALLLKEQNRTYVFIGIIISLILILVIYLYINLVLVKRKIQSQKEQLTRLNQTKDKFFGIIAHDIRSPLLGLQGVGNQVDYFLKKGKTDRLEQVSKNISNTTKLLNDLLDNLLNWALLQNGMIPYHPENVELKPIVEVIMGLLTPLAAFKNVTIENNVREGLTVFADEKAINTVLRNLLSNALKYSKEYEKVSIDTREEEHLTSIIVIDSGTGIPAEKLSRLFELDKESEVGTMGEKGSGLGLILCRELVELNQGNIEVESKLGEGSAFTFKLPKST